MSSPVPSLPQKCLHAFTLLIAAGSLGGLAPAREGERHHAWPDPRVDPAEMKRWALREFDRFLDHHPLLEDRLRINPRLVADRLFLAKNTELRRFLRENPYVAEELQLYPRYYLNRALLRQATIPLNHADLDPLLALFGQQPGLERELAENPRLIRDVKYQRSHPALRDCLLQHPVLARVYLH